jgi:hypothetical protein
MAITDDQAIKLWKQKVFMRSQEVDPSSECDWHDLAYGFLLALDFDPMRAESLIEQMIDLRII